MFISPGALVAPALLLTLTIDWLFGEPPVRWHPVVWMGAYLGWAGQLIAPMASVPAGSLVAPTWHVFWRGALAWAAGLLLVLVPTLGLVWLMWGSAWWWQVLVLGVLLKPLLAWRMMHDEIHAVEVALDSSLGAARHRLARLVSRDVTTLDAFEVRESAIESLAENLNDSVVAPLFWFALAGLPGAVIYRFANTADAMWGYPGERNGRQWHWAGKWTAHADDVLSWLPARLTAILICTASGFVALGQVRTQAQRTPSPNSGWPMAAMALALNVRLAKLGVYVLNDVGHAPQREDSEHGLQLAGRVVQIIGAVALLTSLLLLWRAIY